MNFCTLPNTGTTTFFVTVKTDARDPRSVSLLSYIQKSRIWRQRPAPVHSIYIYVEVATLDTAIDDNSELPIYTELKFSTDYLPGFRERVAGVAAGSAASAICYNRIYTFNTAIR